LELLLLWHIVAQVSSDALSLLSKLLLTPHPEVRAAAVFALSICIQARSPTLLSAWLLSDCLALHTLHGVYSPVSGAGSIFMRLDLVTF